MLSTRRTLILGAALASSGLVSIGRARAEVKGQMLDYKEGDAPLQGYLTHHDKITGKRPGVLMVPARDGLSDFAKEQADKIAEFGYVVLAADIFGKGIVPKNVKEAQAQSAKFNKDRPLMRARALAGLEALRRNPLVDGSKIATVGYCFGGTVVIELAHTGAALSGTVTVHGSFRNFTPGAAKNIKGRVLILHGAEDPSAPLSEVDLVINELRLTKVDWEMELYGGAHHGFTRPKDAIEARANARSWDATRQFFGEVLKA